MEGSSKKFIAPASAPSDDRTYANYSNYAGQTFYLGDTQTGSNAQYNLTWIRVSDDMYILDRAIFNYISYSQATSLINQLNRGSGVVIDGIHYTVKMLSDSSSNINGSTINNDATATDWGKLRKACNGQDSLMHWKNMYSWTSATSYGLHVLRGFGSASDWYGGDGYGNYGDYNGNRNVGFRPALVRNSG